VRRAAQNYFHPDNLIEGVDRPADVNPASWFEIVPNISEGRRPEIIDACVAAIAGAGARVLHRTSDAAHHRSVITAAGGPPKSIGRVGRAGGRRARPHRPARRHPAVRIRASARSTCCPSFRSADATLDEAAALARSAAARILARIGMPSYLYGAAAARRSVGSSPTSGAGEFEGLAARLADSAWQSTSATRRHASAGAIAIVCADRFLIAFNVDWQAATSTSRDGSRACCAVVGRLRTLKVPGLACERTNVCTSRAT